MPKRIQRKRARGWKMQDQSNREVVYVGRPTKWGNPFKGTWAVDQFRAWAVLKVQEEPGWLEPLRGKDLACWCPLDQPCHADVLLELANEKEV